ncbi:MAG: hypothetical protein K5896_08375 [Prevotella sp.]|nr:hypothetical protein [Prevotella sp.]
MKRISEKIVSAVLMLLAVVLAVLCVQSIQQTQQSADATHHPSFTSQPLSPENGRE